jgi:hypothetical protein
MGSGSGSGSGSADKYQENKANYYFFFKPHGLSSVRAYDSIY